MGAGSKIQLGLDKPFWAGSLRANSGVGFSYLRYLYKNPFHEGAQAAGTTLTTITSETTGQVSFRLGEHLRTGGRLDLSIGKGAQLDANTKDQWQINSWAGPEVSYRFRVFSSDLHASLMLLFNLKPGAQGGGMQSPFVLNYRFPLKKAPVPEIKTVMVKKKVKKRIQVPAEYHFEITGFEDQSDRPSDDQQKQIQKVAALMHEYPNLWDGVKVIGHTSAIGDPEKNQKISKKRARSVASALIQTSKEFESKIQVEAHGGDDPVDLKFPGSLYNRRVSVVIHISQASQAFWEKTKALADTLSPKPDGVARLKLALNQSNTWFYKQNVSLTAEGKLAVAKLAKKFESKLGDLSKIYVFSDAGNNIRSYSRASNLRDLIYSRRSLSKIIIRSAVLPKGSAEQYGSTITQSDSNILIDLEFKNQAAMRAFYSEVQADPSLFTALDQSAGDQSLAVRLNTDEMVNLDTEEERTEMIAAEPTPEPQPSTLPENPEDFRMPASLIPEKFKY